jgi:transcriptional regulator with XRE-family HTH domain
MKLKEFLVKERYNSVHLSKACGVSKQHIAAILRGEMWPSKKLAEKIEKFTKGAVKAQDIVKVKEKKICPTCKRPIPRQKK